MPSRRCGTSVGEGGRVVLEARIKADRDQSARAGGVVKSRVRKKEPKRRWIETKERKKLVGVESRRRVKEDRQDGLKDNKQQQAQEG